jgi:DNA polymerase I-like protein with 3'-5' exonuclease and polymerase domains
MARWDSIGLLWQDIPVVSRGAERTLGPMPPIPETNWKPPSHFPNIIDAPWIALDCETYDPELNEYGPGWARGKGHIVGVSICTPAGAWYFPVKHTIQSELNLDADLVFKWLRYSLAGRQPKIGANLIYDIGWFRQEGINVNGPLYDVQYAEALLDETARLSLELLGWKYLRRGKTTDLLKEWIQAYYGTSDKKWRADIWRSPPSLAGHYAEDDARMPYQILMQQWPLLVSRGLIDLFEMECKLMRLLIDMRFEGVQIDLNYAERLREDLERRGKEELAKVEHLAGGSVNVNSGEQLSRVFDKLGLYYPRTAPTERAPTGNPSFTAEVLKATKHPIAGLILKTKEIEKIRSTFVQGYMLDSHVNGKIYCSFHPLMGESGGAKTGRFSSSDPNLQNIPVRTAEGKAIRLAFVCDDGHEKIRAYDYSQIEYRMLAHFAVGDGSEELRARYWNDPKTDFHNFCGDLIKTHTAIELARSYIKNINFGLTYGMGLEHLAESLGVSIAEAQNLLNSYHSALPFAKKTMEKIGEDVQRDGVCYTILNRQTHFDLWEPRDWKRRSTPLPYGAAVQEYGLDIIRAYAYRALNYKLQGSAADVMKSAMVKCYEDGIFAATGVPRMTVHDELVFSDPGSVPHDAWREMQHAMETCIPGVRVPLKAEAAEGPTWGHCK